MALKNKIFLIAALIICSLASGLHLSAQDGNPILHNYPEPGGREAQIWSVAQDRDNVMLFASRSGILSFNGYDWKNIRVPFIPIVLRTHPVTARVYVAGSNNFGYLERDKKGVYNYNSILQTLTDPVLFTRILITDTSMWLYGAQGIYEVANGRYLQKNKLSPPDGEEFTGIFKGPSKIFVNVSGTGLHRIEGDTLFPIVTGYLTADREVLFSLPFSEKMVLLGMDNSKLYLFDGIKFYDFDAGDDGYLESSILSEGIVVSDSLYAFSTLNGGTLIYNRLTRGPLFVLNYQNGLPDDEIFSIGTDNYGGVWMSHTFGLSRADIAMPVRNFGIYPGLKGNVSTTLIYGGKLFVATSEGVFVQKEIRDYEESVVRVEVKRESMPEETTSEIVSSKADISQPEGDTKKSRQTIFNKLFGKKQTAEEPKADEGIKPTGDENQRVNVDPGKSTERITTPAPREFVNRKVTTLKGIRYVFEKVPGLKEKARMMIPTQEGILVATNRGLYIIENEFASVLIEDLYINDIVTGSAPEHYFIATNSGYLGLTFDGEWEIVPPALDPEVPVYSIYETNGNLWLGSDDVAYRHVIRGSSVRVDTFTIKTDFPQRYFLGASADTIMLIIESGVHYLVPGNEDFLPYYPETYNIENNLSFVLSRDKRPWLHANQSYRFASHGEETGYQTAMIGLFDKLVSIRVEGDYLWLVDDYNRLLRVGGPNGYFHEEGPGIHIVGITDESGEPFELFDTYFTNGEGEVYLKVAAPYYTHQSGVEYQFFIEGLMDDWSKWNNDPQISVLIAPGSYNISVRARDIFGRVGNVRIQRVTIKPPFTRSLLFYVLAGIIFAAGLWAFIMLRERKLQHDKRNLEEKVKERTAEIEAQKQEITSSIEYASRIQEAMLPSQNLVSKAFADHFIIFKPRDIVSGDFYWLAEDGKKIYLAVADCTGHGVPGAFMSLLGISALNEIVSNSQSVSPGEILTLLRDKIKRSLNQTGKSGEAADGMDMTICIFDFKKQVLEYAGAYNSLYMIRDGKLSEYKADRMPIGIFHGEELPFSSFNIKLKKGDLIYLLSDGFADQFGDREKGKYKKSRIKKLIVESSSLTLSKQKEKMEREFDNWRGSLGQIDDVTILCVKV